MLPQLLSPSLLRPRPLPLPLQPLPCQVLCSSSWHAGSETKVWELSLRIMRRDAADGAQLVSALQLLVQLCEELGRHGWDAAAPLQETARPAVAVA